MATYRASYDLQRDDVAEAYKWHLNRMRPAALWYGILALYFVCAILLILVTGFKDWTYTFVIVGVLLGVLRPLLLRQLVNKTGDLTRYRGATSVFSDEGVDIQSPVASAAMRWPAYVAFAETKNLFLLYQNPRVFNMFPKRGFVATDIESVRSLLRSKLPQR